MTFSFFISFINKMLHAVSHLKIKPSFPSFKIFPFLASKTKPLRLKKVKNTLNYNLNVNEQVKVKVKVNVYQLIC